MSKLSFLKEGLKNINTTGTITRSSKYVAAKMLKYVDFKTAKCVVELGAGDGVLTTHILAKMNQDSKLIAFEVLDNLVEDLKKIEDERLIVAHDSAEKIAEYLTTHNFKQADIIISAIPFVALPDELALTILQAAYDALPKGGKMIQLNYSPLRKKYYEKVFTRVETHFTPLNLPPAFVFECVK